MISNHRKFILQYYLYISTTHPFKTKNRLCNNHKPMKVHPNKYNGWKITFFLKLSLLMVEIRSFSEGVKRILGKVESFQNME